MDGNIIELLSLVLSPTYALFYDGNTNTSYIIEITRDHNDF